MKAKDVFKVGENNIGYVSDTFIKEFGNEEITKGNILPFQKLPRYMSDSEIINQLKVQEVTLSDVLETLKNAPQELKDGYSNIFYIKGCSRVVGVYWGSDGGGWGVRSWRRGSVWDGGHRVFSPANSGAGSVSPSPESTLTLEFCECERCPNCKKIIK